MEHYFQGSFSSAGSSNSHIDIGKNTKSITHDNKWVMITMTQAIGVMIHRTSNLNNAFINSSFN
ncbi:MAG: hypothetical protein EBS98_09250 [Chitinophagia bacterium]|nr:hypothetical protein [Chitinophagia bacterium]